MQSTCKQYNCWSLNMATCYISPDNLKVWLFIGMLLGSAIVQYVMDSSTKEPIKENQTIDLEKNLTVLWAHTANLSKLCSRETVNSSHILELEKNLAVLRTQLKQIDQAKADFSYYQLLEANLTALFDEHSKQHSEDHLSLTLKSQQREKNHGLKVATKLEDVSQSISDSIEKKLGSNRDDMEEKLRDIKFEIETKLRRIDEIESKVRSINDNIESKIRRTDSDIRSMLGDQHRGIYNRLQELEKIEKDRHFQVFGESVSYEWAAVIFAISTVVCFCCSCCCHCGHLQK